MIELQQYINLDLNLAGLSFDCADCVYCNNIFINHKNTIYIECPFNDHALNFKEAENLGKDCPNKITDVIFINR